MSPFRTVLLAGAPLASQLDFGNATILRPDFDATFARFLHDQVGCTTPRPPGVSGHVPKWRHVDLNETVETSTSAHPAKSSSTGPGMAAYGDYLEQSEAFADITLGDDDVTTRDHFAQESTLVSFASFESTLLDNEQDHNFEPVVSAGAPIHSPRKVHATSTSPLPVDLKRLPDAGHLLCIQPQTVTVDILVVVIKIEPSRTVHLRKRQVEMEVTEVMVGDETRAGLSISLWLKSPATRVPAVPNGNDLRQQVAHLRPGQIVLMRNIALNVFQKRVCGQSLNRSAARVYTSITILSSFVSDRPIAIDPFLQSKHSRVRAWAATYVGQVHDNQAMTGRGKGKRKRTDLEERLPPDSQARDK